jgi:hypothetical protein
MRETLYLLLGFFIGGIVDALLNKIFLSRNFEKEKEIMFETIKKKAVFSKEEIKELIDKYADTHYVSVDIKPNGCLSIWIGSALKSCKEDNNHDD